MREHEFFAPGPPEEWKERLVERVRKERAGELARKEAQAPWAELKLQWRGAWEFDFRFTSWMIFRDSGAAVGIQPGEIGLETGAWVEVNAVFSETFRGRIEPAGQDGSVLRGHFRLLGWHSMFFVVLGLACMCFALMAYQPLFWLGTALAAVSLLRHGIRLDKYPASQTILAFLEDVARECGETS